MQQKDKSLQQFDKRGAHREKRLGISLLPVVEAPAAGLIEGSDANLSPQSLSSAP